jgi:hypothetical protein
MENPQWLPLSGDSFVNEQDRILLPRRFTYSFPPDATSTDATFRLSDIGGNEIQTIVGRIPASGKMTVRFNEKGTTQLHRYRLEVNSPALTRMHDLAFLDDGQTMQNYWAVVYLLPRVPFAEFNLIDDDGFIRLKKNPDGTESQPDFFEIRIKSRPTFWRYANEQGKKLKLNASLNDYLTHDIQQGIMTSRVMRSASATPTMFSGNGNTRFLPHPVSFGDFQLENGRIITEIRVPRSDLFDV